MILLLQILEDTILNYVSHPVVNNLLQQTITGQFFYGLVIKYVYKSWNLQNLKHLAPIHNIFYGIA